MAASSHTSTPVSRAGSVACTSEVPNTVRTIVLEANSTKNSIHSTGAVRASVMNGVNQ